MNSFRFVTSRNSWDGYSFSMVQTPPNPLGTRLSLLSPGPGLELCEKGEPDHLPPMCPSTAPQCRAGDCRDGPILLQYHGFLEGNSLSSGYVKRSSRVQVSEAPRRRLPSCWVDVQPRRHDTPSSEHASHLKLSTTPGARAHNCEH